MRSDGFVVFEVPDPDKIALGIERRVKPNQSALPLTIPGKSILLRMTSRNLLYEADAGKIGCSGDLSYSRRQCPITKKPLLEEPSFLLGRIELVVNPATIRDLVSVLADGCLSCSDAPDKIVNGGMAMIKGDVLALASARVP